jgi:hypothetical protein
MESESLVGIHRSGPAGRLLRSRQWWQPASPWIPLAAYGAVLLALSGRLALWVDEILQLLGTRDAPSVRALCEWVAVSPGGAPLGYLVQRVSLAALGFSATAARLPSCLSSVLAGFLLFAFGRRIGFAAARSTLSLILFATLPLQFRYALEARPYSQGLLLSIATAFVFLRLVAEPGWRTALLYAAVLAAAVYTQPFTFFTALANLVWAAWRLTGHERRRVLGVGAVAVALAFAAFLPWYFFARSEWAWRIAGGHWSLTWKGVAGMLAKDVTGTYALTLLLIAGIALSFTKGSRLDSRTRSFLLAMALIPIPCAIATDAAFHYMLAARQLLFILPPMVLLAADGVANLRVARRAGCWFFAAAIVSLAVVQDVRVYRAPRANWEAAAKRIRAASSAGACVLTIPVGWATYYEFFAPELRSRKCPNNIDSTLAVVLVATPYVPEAARSGSERQLEAKGLIPDGSGEWVGGSAIRVFIRRNEKFLPVLPGHPVPPHFQRVQECQQAAPEADRRALHVVPDDRDFDGSIAELPGDEERFHVKPKTVQAL